MHRASAPQGGGRLAEDAVQDQAEGLKQRRRPVPGVSGGVAGGVDTNKGEWVEGGEESI